jgi:hypothetical protein
MTSGKEKRKRELLARWECDMTSGKEKRKRELLGADEPTDEELEQEEREFQNSPAGHFFGTVSGAYFELKEIQHERELTDAVLEAVDGLADELKKAVEQARKHPAGIVLDWKQFSEEALEALNRGLKHYGLKLNGDCENGDAWVLKIERHEQEPKSVQ